MVIDVFFYNILGLKVSLADIVGFALSSVAALVALLSIYNIIKAKKVLGGIIGQAFKKIAVGVLMTIFAVSFLGLTFGPLNQYEEMYVALIGPIAWLIGNIYLFLGYRDIIKITKV